MSEQYVNVKKVHAQIMDAFETALEVIETENAVDVVEVVRCKDCKHCCIDLSVREYHLCMRLPAYVPRRVDLMDFCSHGERMADNDRS